MTSVRPADHHYNAVGPAAHDAGEVCLAGAEEDAAEKSGTPDPSVASKIQALRAAERTDLRAVLTPAQATQFDKNAAAVGTRH